MNKILFGFIITIILELIVIFFSEELINFLIELATICSAIFVGWQALESRKANKENIESNQKTATQSTKIALYKERKEFLEKLKEAKKVHIQEIKNVLEENPIYKNILTLKSFFPEILEGPRNQEMVGRRVISCPEELRKIRESIDAIDCDLEKQNKEFMESVILNPFRVFSSVSNESEMLFSKKDLTELMEFRAEMIKVHNECVEIYWKICTEIDAIIDSIDNFFDNFDGRYFGESYLTNTSMNKKEEELIEDLRKKCIDIERKFRVMFKLFTLEHEAKDYLNEAQYKERAMKISFEKVISGLQEITKPF